MSDLITERMLPEFDLAADVATRHRAWGALGALALGLTAEDIALAYGFTLAQLEPYRGEWEQMQPQTHA